MLYLKIFFLFILYKILKIIGIKIIIKPMSISLYSLSKNTSNYVLNSSTFISIVLFRDTFPASNNVTLDLALYSIDSDSSVLSTSTYLTSFSLIIYSSIGCFTDQKLFLEYLIVIYFLNNFQLFLKYHLNFSMPFLY
ncbi:hypothetical protein YYC_05046 [Plasmodium yoelii 17X]|uniref:Uncharacterized protein n=1 Tax=Plasmodium yoelii 17X TaxID=1323249 RepID=V7PFX9_PLAYE|nr:hypothetical protein YYC_05046 [Plasmodium yoelii 17X]